MFGFLKKKVNDFTEGVKKALETKEEETKEEILQEGREAPIEVEAEEIVTQVEVEAVTKPAPKIERPEARKPEAVPKKKGLGERIFGAAKSLIEEKTFDVKAVDPLITEFEFALLQSNVASEVAAKIAARVKEDLLGSKVKRGNEEMIVKAALKDALGSVLKEGELEIKDGETVMFVGINGAGKTTALAKLAKLLEKKGHRVVFAAADTFRAAAIEQLETHANNLGIKVIKHDYGSDAAAVVYDAIAHVKSKGGVVLVDTAGRMHSNQNLMDELRKIKRVNKINHTIFVGDALTGNDATEQARTFDREIGVEGIILCKADVDEKGGAAISVSEVTSKPIVFLGTGQGYDDLVPFRKAELLAKLGFE